MRGQAVNYSVQVFLLKKLHTNVIDCGWGEPPFPSQRQMHGLSLGSGWFWVSLSQTMSGEPLGGTLCCLFFLCRHEVGCALAPASWLLYAFLWQAWILFTGGSLGVGAKSAVLSASQATCETSTWPASACDVTRAACAGRSGSWKRPTR